MSGKIQFIPERVNIPNGSVHNGYLAEIKQNQIHKLKGYPVQKYYQKRSRGHHSVLILTVSILLTGLLSACSSGLQVRSDIDPTADFNQFKTYNFFEPLGIEGGYNSPVFGEHYRSSIGDEMARRGYRISYEPDLLINVTLRSDDKVKMKSFTSPYMTGGYYGRAGGAYAGSAVGVGISAGRAPTMTSEASVFIDFVDFKQHKVVWQGVAVVDVNDKVALQLRDAIYTSVNKVLMEYPHTAGK